jgi:four helix bundle protein
MEKHGGQSIRAPAKDIQARTFAFACRIVKLHEHLTKRSGPNRSLAGQVLRAGTSIGANLEEAHAAQSKADFISKSQIALKEARETHYWIRLFMACGTVPAKRLSPLAREADELVAILTAIVRNARASPKQHTPPP